MDELQAGVEPAFAVLSQSSVFLQPRKAALDYPALGHNLEGVQLAALGNLHRDVLTQALAHTLRKGLARVAALSVSTLLTCPRVLLQRLNACSAPLRSVTSAVVTATGCGSPNVSTAIWRLIPETFLPAS